MTCRVAAIPVMVVLIGTVVCSAQATSSPPNIPPKLGVSKQIGDFSVTIKECDRTGDTADSTVPDFPIRCVGNIENKTEIKLRVEFNGGRIIDDAGNEYRLWNTGPWGGVVANFTLGTGCCGEDLLPGLPIKFALWLDHVKREAASVNVVLNFTSTGKPPQSEVVFKGLPILRH
jgi:hypothetical protein